MATEFQAYGGAVPVYFTTRLNGDSMPVRVVNRAWGPAMPIKVSSAAIGGSMPVWSSTDTAAMPVYIVGPGSTTPLNPNPPVIPTVPYDRVTDLGDSRLDSDGNTRVTSNL